MSAVAGLEVPLDSNVQLYTRHCPWNLRPARRGMNYAGSSDLMIRFGGGIAWSRRRRVKRCRCPLLRSWNRSPRRHAAERVGNLFPIESVSDRRLDRSIRDVGRSGLSGRLGSAPHIYGSGQRSMLVPSTRPHVERATLAASGSSIQQTSCNLQHSTCSLMEGEERQSALARRDRVNRRNRYRRVDAFPTRPQFPEPWWNHASF